MENLYMIDIKYKHIINSLSMTIKPNNIHGLIGENGAGKSTLMKILIGINKNYKGSIFFSTEDLKNDSIQSRKNKSIGSIIEQPPFYPFLTGKQNIKNYLNLYNKKVEKNFFDNILKMLNLYDVRNKKVTKYSLGMKQRLALAQIFLLDPDIIVLDEPFNGLDPEITISIKQYIVNLRNKDKYILISSHLLKDMEDFCDEFTMLKNGKNIYHDYITKHVKSSYTYLLTVDSCKKTQKVFENHNIIYEISNEDNQSFFVDSLKEGIPNIIKLLVDNNIKLYTCKIVDKSLEDIFLEYN